MSDVVGLTNHNRCAIMYRMWMGESEGVIVSSQIYLSGYSELSFGIARSVPGA